MLLVLHSDSQHSFHLFNLRIPNVLSFKLSQNTISVPAINILVVFLQTNLYGLLQSVNGSSNNTFLQFNDVQTDSCGIGLRTYDCVFSYHLFHQFPLLLILVYCPKVFHPKCLDVIMLFLYWPIPYVKIFRHNYSSSNLVLQFFWVLLLHIPNHLNRDSCYIGQVILVPKYTPTPYGEPERILLAISRVLYPVPCEVNCLLIIFVVLVLAHNLPPL